MNYRITHKTVYRYSEPASLSQNELYLYPRNTASQQVGTSQIVITPEPQYLQQRTDYFGNTAHVFMVQHPHSELIMTVSSAVSTASTPPVPPGQTPSWEMAAAVIRQHFHSAELVASEFSHASPLIPLLDDAKAYANVSFPPGRPVLEGALELIGRVYADFTYDKEASEVDTPLAEVMLHRKGVCQDFAHLVISCLRSLGLAARYVSGYLETRPPPGTEKLQGADASHAWVSLYIPGFGWIDLDPTNNMLVGPTHITIAWGRDYGDVTPVKGVVMGGGKHQLAVMVDVLAGG